MPIDANPAAVEYPLPPGLPQDWRLDLDLTCPVCDFNLRSARTPRCNECGTTFRWQTLLQIGCPRCGAPLFQHDGDRCPACNLELDWAALLGRDDQQRLRLYEYSRHPFRAAIRSWLAALFPHIFWRALPLESPPHVRRLRWLRVWAWFVFLVGVAAWVATYLFLQANAAPTYMPPVDEAALFSIALCVPPLLTAIALPMFGPTLARLRIRKDQILRIGVFGLTGLVWLGLLHAATAVVLLVFFARGVVLLSAWGMAVPHYVDPQTGIRAILSPMHFLFQDRFEPRPFAGSAVFVACLLLISVAWWLRYLFVALHRYLRLPKSDVWALILATQTIAVLSMLLVLLQHQGWMRFLGHCLAFRN